MRNTNVTTAVGRIAPGQAIDIKGSDSGITHLQVRRIVASLEAGHAERNIAEAERLPERIVRRVRQLEFERRSRQMTAVGVAVGGMLDNVRSLHRDIDTSVFEELIEGAA